MSRHRRPAAAALSFAVGVGGACATPPAGPRPTTPRSPPNAVVRPTTEAATASMGSPPAGQIVADANRPHRDPGQAWWTGLPPGLYRRGKTVSAMAVGRSRDHLHPAEGFLAAKVDARVAVRRAASTVALNGPMPEPSLEDLFITADGTYWALYRLDVPRNARLPPTVHPWVAPTPSAQRGRHRFGRHLFEGERHLFLECDVEGPIANPDWGQTRASAALGPPPKRQEQAPRSNRNREPGQKR